MSANTDKKFSPMLAANAAESEFQFPAFASAKLDGLRGTVHREGLRSRSMKPFGNAATAKFFSHPALVGFDGEMIVGMPNAKDCFARSTSGLRNGAHDPKAVFYVFDIFDMPASYRTRFETLQKRVAALPAQFKDRVVVLPQVEVHSLAELLKFEQSALRLGFEGLIVRSGFALYKQGRSTVNEGALLKLKRFVDAEGELLGIVEQLQNQNEAMRNEVGRTHRSSAKDGLVPKGTMGALVLRDLESGIIFSVGTGFDDAKRAEFWKLCGVRVDIQATDNGKISAWTSKRPMIIKYKHFEVGAKTAPRFPVFLGERIKEDM